MSRTLRIPLLLALAAGLCLPVRSAAQASTAFNALGYGSLGAAAGVLATAGASCDGPGFICIPNAMVFATIGGLVAGVTVGAMTASSANDNVAEGRPVGSGHRLAVTIGAGLGGAVTGALASALLINGEGSGTFLGSDEQTVAILASAGAIFAVVRQNRSWNRAVRAIDFQPLVTLDGQAGLSGTIRF